MALLRFVPEEVLSLCQFLSLGLSAIHGFKCVWMITAIPCLCAYGHRCRREVLHLLQLEVEPFGYYCKFSHVGFSTPRMTAYEVRNNLLAKVLFFVYLVKYSLEIVELTE